ncbi:MAG TPA: trehalose-phosphatase [Phycisphaerae bacterium]|nr:trehalose-phosphatase [Phycisphaerae bacterium]HRY69110.1 trehalose-phosphatase [Phycisphaerae bacterium]HSA29456.1 trehalose-phosphatase [Phycisphaerae bacterium]
MTDHSSKLGQIAESPILLVASDYDGTLAPIVSHPADARLDARSAEALVALGKLPHTHAAVISGRARSDLVRAFGGAAGVELIGSHGVETDDAGPATMTEPQRSLFDTVASALGEIVSRSPGCLIEHRPTGVALHHGRATSEVIDQARRLIMDGPATLDGVELQFGTGTIELTVVPGNKGSALRALRHRLGASTTVFIGDDFTDEDAFRALTPGDLGIVVGTHETLASLRLTNTDSVADLLVELVALRKAWVTQRVLVPIERHAILSDQRTIAVVEPTGCISWLCLPRLDATPIFARLLGGDAAGYFTIVPANGDQALSQAYGEDSFILHTQWPAMTVTDYLDGSGGRPFQRAGRTDLIRRAEGRGKIVVRFAPRLDCGRLETHLMIRENGLELEGVSDPIVLSAPRVSWQLVDEGQHKTAIAEIDLVNGPCILELRYGTRDLSDRHFSESERRQQTLKFWTGWAQGLRIPNLAPAHIRRSALILKALSYGPTGAIAAAGTTSLPEQLGGERNWDYRLCWPRDAALAAAALVQLGNTGVAMRLCDWLLGIVDQCESPDRLRPIYTVTGGHLGSEAQINELRGYGDSRPVRVGNAAAHQVQLDVFGPIAGLIALLAEKGAPISPDHWRLMKAMVAAVEMRWREADHGIWETRGPRRHHVHSKVMCWYTVDRAIYVQDQFLGHPNRDWEALREYIRADVIENGWNRRIKAFTVAYGEDHLDAAALQVGLTGLLEPCDERFSQTVQAVEEHLRDGPCVYRYRYDDGLPGREGAFHLCTWWLLESYLRLGRVADAQKLFAGFVEKVGSAGLLSEEYDPIAGRALGNFPQAYSHLALINSAVALAQHMS